MSSLKIGRSHRARKALFTRGIRRGYLVLEEIDEALPSGSLTDAERWLLFYSLRAAHVEVRDRSGKRVDLRSHAGEKPADATLPVPRRLDAAEEARLEAEEAAADEADAEGEGEGEGDESDDDDGPDEGLHHLRDEHL